MDGYIKCPECGSRVREQDKFCGECGCLLPLQNIVPARQTAAAQKKSKRLLGVTVLLGAAACAMAVAVLLLFFGQGNSSQEGAEAALTDSGNHLAAVPESTEAAGKAGEEKDVSEKREVPYWQKYLKKGENVLTEKQQEEIFLLFRKAWTYYGGIEQVYVDMDELDVVSPDDSLKKYAPHTVTVDKDGRITALFHIIDINDSEGSFSVLEYFAQYNMSEDSPYEHFNLIYYEKGREHMETSFQKATASSVLKSQEGNSYSPSNLVDQNSDTAWMEGIKGYGIGSWVKVAAASPHEVYGIAIRNGYNKSDKSYTVNAKPKKVKFTFSDKSSVEYTLNDFQVYSEGYSDIILLDEPVRTKYVKMTIQSIYEGENYYSYDGETDGEACSDMGFDEIFLIH